MLIAPHWELREYLHEFRQDENDSNAQRDARWPVLTMLILHANNRLRCWPSTDTLCKETGFTKPTVVEARKWLLKKHAIELVPFDKREGKEKELPPRQFIYQLSGSIMTSQGIRPYIAMTPETKEAIAEEIANNELEGKDSKPLIVGEGKDSKRLASLPKGSTNKEGIKPNGAQVPSDYKAIQGHTVEMFFIGHPNPWGTAGDVANWALCQNDKAPWCNHALVKPFNEKEWRGFAAWYTSKGLSPLRRAEAWLNQSVEFRNDPNHDEWVTKANMPQAPVSAEPSAVATRAALYAESEGAS